MSWMDVMLCTIVKVTKCKSEQFEHAQSMSKRPEGSPCIDNIINYLIYLPDIFPRGLEVDLEKSSIFSTLMLSMYINRLRLLSYLYWYLIRCITMFKGSWTALQPFA